MVFPAAAGAFESAGTFTNSERRVQRVRKTLDPPGEAREDLAIICDLARKLGHDWTPDAEVIWNEVRQLSPVHAGMSYARLDQHSGLQWPCYDDRPPPGGIQHRRADRFLCLADPSRRRSRSRSCRSGAAPWPDLHDVPFPR